MTIAFFCVDLATTRCTQHPPISHLTEAKPFRVATNAAPAHAELRACMLTLGRGSSGLRRRLPLRGDHAKLPQMQVVSESESDEDDEMDLLLADRSPGQACRGGGIEDTLQRERWRNADCQALSRGYWDAVFGMSTAVDLESVGARLGPGTRVGGPLWEVSRAATEDELPKILCHFHDPRLRLRVCSPTCVVGSALHDDDDSDECAEMRRAFEDVNRRLYMQDEEARVGLLISKSTPYTVMEVKDVVYSPEGRNEHQILPGDVLVKVDDCAVLHATAKRLHSLLAGEPYSLVCLTLSRDSSNLERGIEYSVTLLRRISAEQTRSLDNCEFETDSLEDAAPAGSSGTSKRCRLGVIERARAHAVELMLRPRAQQSALHVDDVIQETSGTLPSTAANLAWHEPAYKRDRCEVDDDSVSDTRAPNRANDRKGGRDCSAQRIAREIRLMRGGA